VDVGRSCFVGNSGHTWRERDRPTRGAHSGSAPEHWQHHCRTVHHRDDVPRTDDPDLCLLADPDRYPDKLDLHDHDHEPSGREHCRD
jgi:hypothetical protein